MMQKLSHCRRVLAIDPTTRGFAYAVFEGPSSLLDWGLTYVSEERYGDRARRLEKMMERYGPDVLVLEDCNRLGSRRSPRARRLIEDATIAAHRNGIRTARFRRSAIKQFFSYAGEARKHEIALAIAEIFPELAPRLPRLRKIWMSEDERMSIFDAASLALLYYGVRQDVGNQLKVAA